MRQRRLGTVLVIFFVALVATSHAAFAQRTSGGISGTITDSTGGVLPGVSVTATCTETNQARTAITDTQGGFTFPELPVCDGSPRLVRFGAGGGDTDTWQ